MPSSLELLYIHLLKLSGFVFVFVFIFKPLMQERQCLQIKANSGSSIGDGNWILSLLGSRPSKVILQLQGGPGSCCGIQDPWLPCLAAQDWTWQPLPPLVSQACREWCPPVWLTAHSCLCSSPCRGHLALPSSSYLSRFLPGLGFFKEAFVDPPG